MRSASQERVGKKVADCVEALVAVFYSSSGENGVIAFLEWLGLPLPEVKQKGNSLHDESEEGLNRCCLDKIAWTRSRGAAEVLNTASIAGMFEEFERKIGYYFRNKQLLLTAFTHISKKKGSPLKQMNLNIYKTQT